MSLIKLFPCFAVPAHKLCAALSFFHGESCLFFFSKSTLYFLLFTLTLAALYPPVSPPPQSTNTGDDGGRECCPVVTGLPVQVWGLESDFSVTTEMLVHLRSQRSEGGQDPWSELPNWSTLTRQHTPECSLACRIYNNPAPNETLRKQPNVKTGYGNKQKFLKIRNVDIITCIGRNCRFKLC